MFTDLVLKDFSILIAYKNHICMENYGGGGGEAGAAPRYLKLRPLCFK